MTDELTKDEFCARFVARMVADSGEEHREYAAETAPTYFDDPDQRAEGPEECADADMSYWGDE